MKGRIIVALDVQNRSDLDRLIGELAGRASIVKVGMELFYSEGPQVVQDLLAKKLDIFLDLKMHDIPNTVGKTAKALTKMGVKIFNLHAAGGADMMKSAVAGIEEALRENTALMKPKLIAVTQLTSTTPEVLKKQILIDHSMEETILSYAALAKECGLDGVVCSPLEVPMIKEKLGAEFLCITPGVRPAGSNTQDQKRITTPAAAIQNGSDYLVIGRPITGAQNVGDAFQNILEEINNA